MKKKFVNSCLSFIVSNQPDLSNQKLEVISYGLSSLYLTFSKLFIISFIAICFKKFSLFFCFMIIYNIIRMPSFGLHASKSWACLLMSIVLLIILPCFLDIVIIPTYIKGLLGIISIAFIFKNSPADTKKRPIVNIKRRRVYQQLSTLIACCYILFALAITNNFISNCFLVSVILQNFLIAPTTYRVFHLPYNNYKQFLLLHPEFS